VVWQTSGTKQLPNNSPPCLPARRWYETPDESAIILIAKSYRNIYLDLIQACDKRAMETPHLLVAAVRAVSVVVVLVTVADERHADEAIDIAFLSISVCGLYSLPHLLLHNRTTHQEC
jgi:hypothetical protein